MTYVIKGLHLFGIIIKPFYMFFNKTPVAEGRGY